MNGYPARSAGGFASKDDWRVCRELARVHGRTFFFASGFLPPQRRAAMLSAYAFCRIADDTVDRAVVDGTDARAGIDAWEAELDEPTHPVAHAFAATRDRYGISLEPVRELLSGVRMDLEPQTYETWDDLKLYCYRVAGTVGLIAAPILGCRDDDALPHAAELGIAMQLTNILRDVAEDAVLGRIYLPREELRAFGVCPDSLLHGHATGRFPELIAFQIDRARALYREGRQGVKALCPSGQLTTLACSQLYSNILNRIEEERYDVLNRRAFVPTHRKVRAVPSIAASFLRMQLGGAVR
jgi:phytoene synthase